MIWQKKINDMRYEMDSHMQTMSREIKTEISIGMRLYFDEDKLSIKVI